MKRIMEKEWVDILELSLNSNSLTVQVNMDQMAVMEELCQLLIHI